MHSTRSLLTANPRLRFEHDLRGWTSVTITPANRNPDEYVATVRHAIATGTMLPSPKDETERRALEEAFPEIATAFCEGVV